MASTQDQIKLRDQGRNYRRRFSASLASPLRGRKEQLACRVYFCSPSIAQTNATPALQADWEQLQSRRLTFPLLGMGEAARYLHATPSDLLKVFGVKIAS